MKTLLTTIMLVSCIGGGTASAYLTNKTNEKNEIKITTPKKANDTQTFNLELEKRTGLNQEIQLNEDKYLYSQKKEYYGINSALETRLEHIVQSEYNTNLNDGNYPSIVNTPTGAVNMLYKYQITPYNYLYDAETTSHITMSLRLKVNDFITSNQQLNATLKLKITKLTSLQNWSTYINQTNWYVQNANNIIINQIKDPMNAQLFQEEIEIKEIPLTNNSTFEYIEINQEINITKNGNDPKTNYIFIYIQPYIENLLYGNYVGYTNPTNKIWAYNDDNYPITINGKMIIPPSNYEVIDIPYIMFNILTMPFAFISTAFNLTLFPGTPYQVNLSNLFLTIVAIFIFIYIIKIIFKR